MNKYEYQLNNNYIAQVSGGMEDFAYDELQSLGIDNIELGHRTLIFKCDKKQMYTANYSTRTISRILAPLISFTCFDKDKLYKTALNKIKWENFLSVNQTFAIFSNVSDSIINHSQYASLILKDAIVDYFRRKKNRRPSIDKHNPDVWFNLHISNNKARICVDTSGGSLHKRGYRTKTVDAPMQETLASAVIKLSDWDGSKPLYDIMCGGGTLLAEALMYINNVPPAYFRTHFGFEKLPDYDGNLWKKVKSDADSKIKVNNSIRLYGNDRDEKAIRYSKKNLSKIPGNNQISFIQKDFRQLNKIENAVIVVNPPYGIRMKPTDNMKNFYKSLGDFLKNNCKGSTAYIYFGEREYIKHIGLRTSFKKQLSNGGLDGRLVKIELY